MYVVTAVCFIETQYHFGTLSSNNNNNNNNNNNKSKHYNP